MLRKEIHADVQDDTRFSYPSSTNKQNPFNIKTTLVKTKFFDTLSFKLKKNLALSPSQNKMLYYPQNFIKLI